MPAAKVRRLVLINGPIASGKTTIALALATRARAAGHVAASIDMDEMIALVAGEDWSAIHHADRERACRVTSSLVQTLFDDGTQFAVIAGSTLAQYEWDEVTNRLEPRPEIVHVLLLVSVQESIRRTQDDPSRVRTKDPSFVARLAGAIDWDAVGKPDIEIDTDGMTALEVTALISQTLRLS
jgi:adenylylsulfate kinase-like enzyme